MDYKKNKLPQNPIARANPISKILFLWIFPLFRKGYRKELQETDLYSVLKEDETGHVGDKLGRYWQMDLDRARKTGEKPSLLRALVKMSWKTFFFVSLVFILNQCVIIVLQPVILRYLILTFNDPEAETWKGYAYAGGISLLVFLATITYHPGVFVIMRLAMKLRIATSTLIYRKSLRLSKSGQNQTSSGQIVNLLSNDCTRFDSSFAFLPFIATAPIQVTILMYLLYGEIGMSCMAGLGFIVLLLPMQYYLGKYSAIFRLKIAKRTDERGRFMNEIIIGMRVIKQYAWEKPFSKLIDGVRKLEVIELKKRGLLRGLHHAIFTLAPKLVQFLTFLTFVLIEDEPMIAARVFFTVTCLHTMMQTAITYTPSAFAGIGEILVAVNRIQDFLLLDEQQSNNNLQLFNVPNLKSRDEIDELKKLTSAPLEKTFSSRYPVVP